MAEKICLSAITENPVIAAVKNEEELNKCLCGNCSVVFVLYGSICDISSIVDKIKQAGKIAVVHMDFVSGLVSKEIAAEYIKQNTAADGILSTKPALIRRAKELGLVAIQRFFIIDSMALKNTVSQIKANNPDCVEIMPGVIPKVLKYIRKLTDVPVIAGGLIEDEKDVIAALSAGADAISTTNSLLWEI